MTSPDDTAIDAALDAWFDGNLQQKHFSLDTYRADMRRAIAAYEAAIETAPKGMTPKPEIPAEIVERCAAQAYEDWFTAAKWSECPEANGYKDHWRKETIAVLRACGYAEMREALDDARERIVNCRDHAMFSSKDSVVKYICEALPQIAAALAIARPQSQEKRDDDRARVRNEHQTPRR